MAKTFGHAVAVILMFAIRLAFKLLALTGKVVFYGLMKGVDLLPRSRTLGTSLPAPVVALNGRSTTNNQRPVAEQSGAEPPATIFCDGFAAADRIVSMRLEPAVGVINLRVFYDAGVVKRDLIIQEPRLKALMGGRRHSFPDVPYVPTVGLDAVKDDAIRDAERLINDLGNQSVKGTKPRKDDFVRARAQPAPQPQQPQEQPQPAAPPAEPIPERPTAPVVEAGGAARSAPRRQQPAGHLVAPQIKTGFTYVGRLASAGPKRMEPVGRQPFEVFEAVLRLDNGAEMAMRGAELERELTANGGTVGKRVAITPMGKVPVTLSGGAEGLKNLYRVQVQ